MDLNHNSTYIHKCVNEGSIKTLILVGDSIDLSIIFAKFRVFSVFNYCRETSRCLQHDFLTDFL